MPDTPILNTIYDHGRRIAYAFAGGNRFMSGRWPRRDGDTYGIVQRQPPLKFDPATATLPDADHPPGNIRSSDER